ncbi:hypothetical protein DIPPA_17037 [Diplonema papillatum]|nr:hypothetical protein DIPPA_17037 [Diplonema papillatum]
MQSARPAVLAQSRLQPVRFVAFATVVLILFAVQHNSVPSRQPARGVGNTRLTQPSLAAGPQQPLKPPGQSVRCEKRLKGGQECMVLRALSKAFIWSSVDGVKRLNASLEHARGLSARDVAALHGYAALFHDILSYEASAAAAQNGVTSSQAATWILEMADS